MQGVPPILSRRMRHGMPAHRLAEVERMTLDAGQMALRASGRSRGATKRDGSWVTRTDREIERHLRSRLHDLVDVKVYGEEEGWSGPRDAPHIAIVDPID